MKLSILKQEWGTLRLENLFGRLVMPLLAVSVLVSVLSLTNQQPIITVLPPNMSESAEIAHNDANEATKKAYGLYVVEMMSNVHPGNVKFMISSLEGTLHPSIYHEAKEDIMDQVGLIKKEDLSITFEARSVNYWSDTNRIVIEGRRITEGRNKSEEMAEMMTYEVEVEIYNYLPQVTYINSYEGRPERKR